MEQTLEQRIIETTKKVAESEKFKIMPRLNSQESFVLVTSEKHTTSEEQRTNRLIKLTKMLKRYPNGIPLRKLARAFKLPYEITDFVSGYENVPGKESFRKYSRMLNLV